MKVSEIRKLSTNELAKQSNDLRREILELRRQAVLGELQNVRIIRTKRRELSRILTVLQEQFEKEAM